MHTLASSAEEHLDHPGIGARALHACPRRGSGPRAAPSPGRRWPRRSPCRARSPGSPGPACEQAPDQRRRSGRSRRSESPATGSSSRSSAGSAASTMPISSHCFSPWARRPGRHRGAGSRPISPRTEAMRAGPLAGGAAGPQPISRFSAHSERGEDAGLLELAPHAGLRDLGLGALGQVDPVAEHHAPETGLVIPEITSRAWWSCRRRFGPITARTSPGSTASERAASRAVKRAEGDREGVACVTTRRSSGAPQPGRARGASPRGGARVRRSARDQHHDEHQPDRMKGSTPRHRGAEPELQAVDQIAPITAAAEPAQPADRHPDGDLDGQVRRQHPRVDDAVRRRTYRCRRAPRSWPRGTRSRA